MLEREAEHQSQGEGRQVAGGGLQHVGREVGGGEWKDMWAVGEGFVMCAVLCWGWEVLLGVR